MAKKTSIFLLLDVLPFELPIIYSNEKLKEFIDQSSEWGKIYISDIKFEETQPVNFSIFKKDYSKRIISLIHPIAQLNMLKFVEFYDEEIINFFITNSIFSIRYPNEINSVDRKYIEKINYDLQFLFNEQEEINNNEYLKYMDSYFSKKHFIKITDFYKSNAFKLLETKYAHLYKMDISNCFYNIYTHSIDWAYLGSKEYAKLNRKGRRFSTVLDEIMSASNHGETNGIVVGPEFSRIVAEIILTRIDNLVYKKLQLRRIVYKRDYEVVRYIDDIFIFSNDNFILQVIREVYQEELIKYKLSINEKKVYFENSPFLKGHNWVIKIKSILKRYFDIYEDPSGLNRVNIKRITNSFLEEVRALIIEFENEKQSIVSFVLSAFEKMWHKLISKSVVEIAEKEIKTYLLCKLIDQLHYILVFSLTAQNVVKYTKLTILINVQSRVINDPGISELIYKKAYELLKYHNKRSTEILNIIISLKHNPKDLPESLLLDILQDENYLSLSTVAYYIDNGKRSFRCKKIKEYINKTIDRIINELEEKFILPSTDKQKIKKLLLHQDFYIIHDFYSSKIITKTNKKQIKKIIDKIICQNWNDKKDGILNIFVDYVKDLDKPFMRWDASEYDLIKTIAERTNKSDTTVSV
ncbi:RNA-directed DNA polymerase [Neobacillus sp.]|uniref:RNA-directed DNA polymerase n=1 Tax=Neobacillus sp. TaxID=2675273 RepID=UPI0028A04B1C|nr:RNA-directed DNA polymerase [Neobacillus sp.]